jgi:hypothetical protein
MTKTAEQRETIARRQAYEWLRDRNGTGVFETNNSVLLAAGERAPFMRGTWNALRDMGAIIINERRVTLVPGFNMRDAANPKIAPEHISANGGRKVARKPNDE